MTQAADICGGNKREPGRRAESRFMFHSEVPGGLTASEMLTKKNPVSSMKAVYRYLSAASKHNLLF